MVKYEEKLRFLRLYNNERVKFSGYNLIYESTASDYQFFYDL